MISPYSIKEVSRSGGFRLDSLAFRNPDFFMAGQLHSCVEEWKKLDTSGFVLDWIQNREDIFLCSSIFRGNLRGEVKTVVFLLLLIIPSHNKVVEGI